MKEETRQHLAQLIAEELAEKIRGDEALRRKLEQFTDLPVEKVADAMIRQFEYLLSSELRDLIIHLIEQDVALDEVREGAPPAIVITPDDEGAPPAEPAESALEEPEEEEAPPETPVIGEKRPPGEPSGIGGKKPSISEEWERHIERVAKSLEAERIEAGAERVAAGRSEAEAGAEDVEDEAEPVEAEPVEAASIMEHFGTKEPFPTEPVEIKLEPGDWLYIYGFCYAPDSTGKGIPTKKLQLKGIDDECDIILVDYGDVRLFVSKLHRDKFAVDNAGKPTPPSSKSSHVKMEHERILNILRTEDVLVPMPFWTVIQGHQPLLNMIERRYVEMLRALIDVHDATEWDVEVLAFDEHIMQLPSMNIAAPQRPGVRQSRQTSRKGAADTRNLEKVMIRERSLAQEIHNELLLLASKQKIDYMVRLDSAVMGDWKSILSARYTIGKDKRRMFCQAISSLEKKNEEYKLMVKVSNPATRFSFDT